LPETGLSFVIRNWKARIKGSKEDLAAGLSYTLSAVVDAPDNQLSDELVAVQFDLTETVPQHETDMSTPFGNNPSTGTSVSTLIGQKIARMDTDSTS
jgi:hypothetical protein